SRWVFFGRNLNLSNDIIIAGVASAMWQLGLPADGISFRDGAGAGPLAGELRAALSGAGVRGLLVRFVTYHTVYFQGSVFKVRDQPDWRAIAELYAEYADRLAKYERGDLEQPPPQPVSRAYSNTVGWIAPWTTHDMRTAPVGRILHGQSVQPANPALRPIPVGPAVLEYAVGGSTPNDVAPVAIDLGSTIPELPSPPAKVAFRTM